MIVAGIDPGLQRTGYAVLRARRSERVDVLDAGVITSDQGLELSERLTQIAEGLDAVFDEHVPALVAVEELYAHYKHPRTAILMGHVRGLVLLAAARREIPVHNLAATAIKKSLTGNGHASKAQVQRAVQVTLGLEEMPELPDVADAIAIALAASSATGVAGLTRSQAAARRMLRLFRDPHFSRTLACMISRMTGMLAEVFEESILVDRDGIGFEMLVPRYAIRELAAARGRRVTLYTLAFLEGNATGGNLIPRLVGFTQPEDRLFFNRFITVKGMGIRKALKSLAEPVAAVAVAIEQGDAKALSRLPGIGGRAAEQIIAELRGKLEAFVVGAGGAASAEPEWSDSQRDALEILAALGERAADARRWLEHAIEQHPETSAADEWVKAAYRVKAGAEG